MRRAARVDGNHVEIVRALRSAGMTVQSLAAVGQGVPDLLIGWRGLNLLAEVKDGDKCASKQALTAAEAEWHATWAGHVVVARDAEEAIAAMLDYWRRLGGGL